MMVPNWLGTAITYSAGVAVGLVVVVIATLNLHIIVGLEEGYAATPAEVFEHSVFLGLFDLVLLVAALTFGVLGARRLRRQGHIDGRDRTGSPGKEP